MKLLTDPGVVLDGDRKQSTLLQNGGSICHWVALRGSYDRRRGALGGVTDVVPSDSARLIPMAVVKIPAR